MGVVCVYHRFLKPPVEGAFFVIVKTDCEADGSFAALLSTYLVQTHEEHKNITWHFNCEQVSTHRPNIVL